MWFVLRFFTGSELKYFGHIVGPYHKYCWNNDGLKINGERRDWAVMDPLKFTTNQSEAFDRSVPTHIEDTEENRVRWLRFREVISKVSMCILNYL